MLDSWTDFYGRSNMEVAALLPPVSSWNTSVCLAVTGVKASTADFLVYARVLNIKVGESIA